MAKAATATAEKVVNEDLLAEALAKAVCDGDIVNFRLLFGPFSPGRRDSTERFESDKYSYLLPNDALRNDTAFLRTVDKVRQGGTWKHVLAELAAKRPPQLPSELLLPLADNAVRLGKYSSAAQAYEMLRMRRRMLDVFLVEGDKALDANDYPTAVKAYLAASGLAYDYSAFPEPLPLTPNFQTEALKLHGVYPTRPEDCPGWLPAEAHVVVAIEFLLVDSEVASRLKDRSHEARLAFLQHLVRAVDPEWDAFVERYRKATTLTLALRDYLQQHGLGSDRTKETLQDEVQGQQVDDPAQIPATLLGFEIEDGTWWQYLKELAYHHPPAVLFVSRQIVGDHEILIPPLRKGEGLASTLGLLQIEDANQA